MEIQYWTHQIEPELKAYSDPYGQWIFDPGQNVKKRVAALEAEVERLEAEVERLEAEKSIESDVNDSLMKEIKRLDVETKQQRDCMRYAKDMIYRGSKADRFCAAARMLH